MKRTALLGALLTAVLVCSLSLSTPKPAHALLCCVDGYQLPYYYWVGASTCSEAISLFRSLAYPDAADICGGTTKVCNFVTPTCYYDSGYGGWVVGEKARFGCREDCGPILP